jgi:NAD(P)-dependent dehydrogenase (short-subunit alcohol dehydrogenase family)
VTPQILGERTILITGGSRGIGAAIAMCCLEAGATVALMSRGADALATTRARLAERFPGRVFAFPGDVTKYEDVQRTVSAAAEIGRLEGLVNNAGSNRPTRLFVDLSREAFNQSIALNLIAYADSTREVVPHFLRSGKGAIVNIASMAGKIGVPAWSAYCAAKHGVLGLTKSLAREFAREGIRCNAVCPGFVETDMMAPERMNEWADALGMSQRDLVKSVIYRDTPQGRYVDEASVAHATVYLLSDLATDITGQSLNVSCGIGDY